MGAPRDKGDLPGAETFLGRWSRRKAEARRERPVEEEKTPAPVRAAPEEAAADENGPLIRPEDLPDIDSLNAASDFKVFMQKGVPEELKTQALRKLWRLKPSLANLDGLLDYGGDFTRTGTGVAGIKTAYQVGRGFLDRAEQPKTRPAPEGATAEADLAGDEQPVEHRADDAQPGAAPGQAPADARPSETNPTAAGSHPGAADLHHEPKGRSGRRPLPRRS